LKPLRPIKAAEVVGVDRAPLVLNTPFTVMKSLEKQTLIVKQYVDFKQIPEYLQPIKNYSTDTSFKPLNVVILVMESFSKEYMGPPYGNEDLTPFLDSLVSQGLFYPNAFANGKKSMEAIPAIIAGIPTLMDDPYITSIYGSNKINSLASLLSEQGYQTSFFHGGATGTMGFDAFCSIAGFDRYYGMEDYPGPDFDGTWGIYDEPFFLFFASELDNYSSPFFATFFSLSSHHPYPIPNQYLDLFPQEKHPILRTIRYADYSLKRFFEIAREKPWYDNTLFIITADHTADAFSDFYRSRIGSYSIPLLFYCPSDTALVGSDIRYTQQIDIMPSVLDYLDYPNSFFSLGNSALDNSHQGFVVNYLNEVYQYASADTVIHVAEGSPIALYYIKGDSALENNLIRELNEVRHFQVPLMAIIQAYNHSMVTNQLTVR